MGRTAFYNRKCFESVDFNFLPYNEKDWGDKMDSKDLIMEAHDIADRKGFNQSRWSANAGLTLNGQTVLRILQRGDCRLSTFISLLRAVGCKLEIKENENERTEN